MTETQTPSTFVAQLQADAEKFQDSTAQEEYCSQVREQAAEHFLENFLSGATATKQFENLVLHRNRLRQHTARLVTWQGRGPTYLDQALSDLLDLGDLLQRLQDHLDSTYGANEFRVFNHHVRGSRNRTMALTVSWDKERFENVDSIIENNRQHALERLKRQQENRTHGDEDEDCDVVDDDELAPRNRAPPRGGPRRTSAPRRYDEGASRNYENRPRRRFDGEERPQRRNNYDDSRSSAPTGPSRRGPADRGSVERTSRRRAAVASYE